MNPAKIPAHSAKGNKREIDCAITLYPLRVQTEFQSHGRRQQQVKIN